MTQSQHTKGPWQFSKSDNATLELFPSIAIYAGDDESATLICEVIHTQRNKVVNSNFIPNARLIAAAPDLLEALETLTALYSEVAPQSEPMKLARAVVAKAKGEQK